ncbi:glycosyltransferase [Aromatoleum toluclasticum]|uniref:glycosyltransferase n=1 Tax=Aromatoleum toluclasticum TaxID=92003 RepID=UPI00037E4EF4|nr:glycosyltransferase [Aromatoleum toluclasticum]MCC4116433.1 glycosyltransferase [Aromatoleum toluclasticum]
MRIAYLINQYPKVSHSFIRREILALERQGFDVLRVAVRGWDAELVDAEDRSEQARTTYLLQDGMGALAKAVMQAALHSPGRFFAALRLALRMGRRADRPWPYHLIYLAEACRALPALRDFEVRHVHAHFGTNPAEVAMLIEALAGVPYSFTVHGPEEFDKPGFLGTGEKIRRSAFVVAISSFGRSQLFRWAAHRDWDRVKIVHCGLEPAFHTVPPTPLPAAPRLVCVGRLCEQKGQLLLVEALARLAEKGIDFEMVLAGDGELRGEIEALVARHGLQRSVRVTGWISSEQVRDEILAARALVLPSFAEGLPVVIMEALALRRPVATTFVAGIPELVRHDENGWLFPAGSVDALAAALETVLATPAAEIERMGEAGRRRVLERHDVDREAAKLGNYFYGARA